jgi:hypothetical protein
VKFAELVRIMVDADMAALANRHEQKHLGKMP